MADVTVSDAQRRQEVFIPFAHAPGTAQVDFEHAQAIVEGVE